MITELVREMTLKVMICTQSQSAGASLGNEYNKTQSQSAGTSLEHFAIMDGRGFFLGSTPFYPGYFFDQQQQQREQQQFGPFMNELHSQLNVGEGSQNRPGSALFDTTSSPTSSVAVASTSSASSPESEPAKKTVYDKWPHDDQKMLIRLIISIAWRAEKRERSGMKSREH